MTVSSPRSYELWRRPSVHPARHAPAPRRRAANASRASSTSSSIICSTAASAPVSTITLRMASMSSALSDRSPSAPRTSACAGDAFASACATSTVRLPSRRSSPAGLPVRSGRRTRRARRRAAGRPRRAEDHTRCMPRAAPATRPRAAPPISSGCSTEYFALLKRITCRADSTVPSPPRLLQHVEVLPAHSCVRIRSYVGRARNSAPPEGRSASASRRSRPGARSPSRIAPAARTPRTGRATRPRRGGPRTVGGWTVARGVSRVVHQVVVDQRGRLEQLERGGRGHRPRRQSAPPAPRQPQ